MARPILDPVETMRIHNHRLMLDKLEKYRLEHRLSQKALGEKLGVAFSTINRWFNHRTRPNKIQRYHIEKLLRNWYG